MLEPVSAPLALLAAFWRLGESVILGHMTLNGMMALNILGHPALAATFSSAQWQAFANLYIDSQADEFSIGLVYYSLGSTLFCCLLESRFVPGVLAWRGGCRLIRGIERNRQIDAIVIRPRPQPSLTLESLGRARWCGRHSPGLRPRAPAPENRSIRASFGTRPRPSWRDTEARRDTIRSPRHGWARS